MGSMAIAIVTIERGRLPPFAKNCLEKIARKIPGIFRERCERLRASWRGRDRDRLFNSELIMGTLPRRV